MTYEVDGTQYVAVAAGGNRGEVTTLDGDAATDSKGTWNTGRPGAGHSGSIAFDSAGTFVYLCLPHPWLLGQVIVQ